MANFEDRYDDCTQCGYGHVPVGSQESCEFCAVWDVTPVELPKDERCVACDNTPHDGMLCLSCIDAGVYDQMKGDTAN